MLYRPPEARTEIAAHCAKLQRVIHTASATLRNHNDPVSAQLQYGNEAEKAAPTSIGSTWPDERDAITDYIMGRAVDSS